MLRRSLAIIGALALTIPASATFAIESPEDPSERFATAPTTGQLSASVSPHVVSPQGDVAVVVEMEGDPVAVVEAESGDELSEGQKESIKDDLKASQDAIVDDIAAAGGDVQGQMQSAYNGIQATVPADEVDAVADLPGVVAVHPVETLTIDNAVSVPFLGVPEVWESTGYTGQNVKVAVIDTGIDYTHATFAGPGTVAAYEAAFATSTAPADAALFGPDAPRIKGGYDFVGDDYDATVDGSIPQPDPNPLDCQGHGSHVAGTAAGGGVNADGTSYTGPYDTTTPSVDFAVGPGVAPQADLYALRVFGCAGSTNVTIQAIDWAVDNDMDVINMSLGSSFGRADDPTAVAATNAVGAGVVVVASAGNSGHNPYITGSPGSGEGVISVAALDSTETFPGATISIGEGEVTAINANGADLAGIGALEVVRVTDDPATPENEALGCSAAAFEATGVTGALAVVDRGTCARVAKAIYGEQAGAAAVVMVNSSDDFPPYEGSITANPDTGDAFEVTIPFLGVRSSDGPTLTAAVGSSASLSPTDLDNPGFRGYASFTSGGPRNGDGAIGPDVVAPGVSTSSAEVGSGAGASIKSGTSMAAPHVAGVAALGIEAHPEWSADDVAASIVSTADPQNVADEEQRLGGVGLVDAAEVVSTSVVATGDPYRTENGWMRDAGLSFGFQESAYLFGGLKRIVIENHGDATVRYTVSTEASAQSEAATVRMSRTSVSVKPGKRASVWVTLGVRATDVPGSLGSDSFMHHEVSGDVVLSSDSQTLRVPYLLVPRSNSKVTVSGTLTTRTAGEQTLRVRDRRGAIATAADFYTWGLTDKRDLAKDAGGSGYDLRAAGVQSFDIGGDQLLVFAVNTHDRWSTAAVNEFDVEIDVDRDGTAEAILFSYDSGAVRAGEFNGLTEVFLQTASGGLYATGYLAQAPTDSSTILLPVNASMLTQLVGLDETTGPFAYGVSSYSLESETSDAFEGTALYDPWAPALSNGQYVAVERNGSASVDVTVDPAAVAEQKPLGVMAVVFDNASGKEEAQLVQARR